MTRHILENPMRAVRAMLLAITIVVALGLVACAPGSGGTGTGPTMTFSGQALVVLTGTAASHGSDVGAACAPQGVQVTLKLEPARVSFTTPCSSFLSVEDWSIDDAGKIVVTGVYETPSIDKTDTVTLTVVLSAEGDQATVSILDAQGMLFMSPVTLQRVPL